MLKSLHLHMVRIKVFSVVLHLAGWLLFMVFPLLFINGNQNQTVLSVLTTLPYLIFCLCYIVLFYVHTYYFVPELFLKKKYVTYVLSVLLLLLAINMIRPFDQLVGQNRGNSGRSILNPTRPPSFGDPSPPHDQNNSSPLTPKENIDGRTPGPPPPNMNNAPQRGVWYVDITSIFIFLIVLAFSMAIRLVKQWQQTEQRALRAETDKANAELSFLKAQINPHFLYNTLNNIYTLSLMQNEHTSESIMKLSNIMRYVIDDATHDFVSLGSEIECISNYIDLQKLRIGSKPKLDFKVEGEIEKYKIAPLILMTFVENLFKYGISKHENTELKINVLVVENQLTFISQNAIFDRKKPIHTTGIGIKNTKQRLDYLYPEKHDLWISDSDNLFIVKLKLLL
ncbi:MAG: histidine kinase [Pedobacter sp.]|nr:MAG: histidine kinase [Pedobacter sp.]